MSRRLSVRNNKSIKPQYAPPSKKKDKRTTHWATYALTNGLWDDEEMDKCLSVRKDKSKQLRIQIETILNQIDAEYDKQNLMFPFNRRMLIKDRSVPEYDVNNLELTFSDKISTLTDCFSIGVYAKTNDLVASDNHRFLANYSGFIVTGKEYDRIYEETAYQSLYGVDIDELSDFVENIWNDKWSQQFKETNFIILGNPEEVGPNFNAREGYPLNEQIYKSDMYRNEFLDYTDIKDDKIQIYSNYIALKQEQNTTILTGEEVSYDYSDLVRKHLKLTKMNGVSDLMRVLKI